MPDLTEAHWHKSTRSGPNNNCVEAALLATGVVAVRDTKQGGAGPVLEFTTDEWIAFLGGAVDGDFDIDTLRQPRSPRHRPVQPDHPARSSGPAAPDA